jgi:hypothetical protein
MKNAQTALKELIKRYPFLILEEEILVTFTEIFGIGRPNFRLEYRTTLHQDEL